MAEFKISSLRFSYSGYWDGDVEYSRDDIVTYRGRLYVCLVPHTSGTNVEAFYDALNYVTPGGAPEPYWNLVIDGREWIGPWSPLTFFSIGTLVSFGGIVYYCTEQHVSDVLFDADKFDIYVQGTNWQSAWEPETAYGQGDAVRYGGFVYICNESHLSAIDDATGIDPDISKWDILFEGVNFTGDWISAKRYKLNDIAKYGPDLWICSESHTSSAMAGFDNTKFELWLPGEEYLGTWSTVANYQVGDVVKYGGYSYYSNTSNNIGNIPSTDIVNWSTLTLGYSKQGEWSTNTAYKIGSVITRDGQVFVATEDNTGQDPIAYSVTSAYDAVGSSGTTLNITGIVSGIAVGMTIVGTGFSLGQRVSQIVTANSLIISSPPDGTLVDEQTVRFVGVNSNYWQLLIPGISWKSYWNSNSRYSIGDLVVYKNATYKCIQHSENNRPDLDITNSYWTVLVAHARNNALTNLGDLKTFIDGLAAPLPAGNENQILQVETNSEKLPKWNDILITPKVFYVAPSGIDSPEQGTTWDIPWKTIKYACQRSVAPTTYTDAVTALEENKQFLIIEMYNWMLYQKNTPVGVGTDPFSPSSMFDEVKTKRDAEFILNAIIYDLSREGTAQSVASAKSFFEQENPRKFITDGVAAQIPYFVAALNKLLDLITTNVFANTSPETLYQTLNGVGINETIIMSETGLVSAPSVTYATNLMNIILTALNTRTALGVPAPNSGLAVTIFVKTGTYPEELPIIVPDNVAIVGDELRGVTVTPKRVVNTIATSSNGTTNTFTVETTAGMYVGCPVQFVSENPFITNIQPFETVNGSLLYPGNIVPGQTYYVAGTITPTTFSVNSALGTGTQIELNGGDGLLQVIGGDALSDMFLIHNATGLRNITLSGLLGTLSEQNEFLTRRPTGGAFVSFDPGYGPNDTSTWIYRRSPYIQNVTTFGQGCVGMKVDGTLHNGGNKSMTANDFTQILQDGIGAWITGPDSKAELVSVFTYYNYTGYFAEDGGRIRGTNGNCSYGSYGAIAEGYDITEAPITASINNQANEASAIVQSSFGANANLLKITYDNAGEGYNQSTTNLLNYSNDFITGWTSDGNTTLQQNLISPDGNANAWTITGVTSNTDSAYVYQDIGITPTGAVYTGVAGSNSGNPLGSGSGATFDVIVSATGYIVTVAAGGNGGTNYIFNDQITIYGSQVGGVDVLNDITLRVASVNVTTILTVTATGTVPSGTARPYTSSVYVKQGSVPSVDMYVTYSGYNGLSTRTSYINFNFETLRITSGTGGDGGLTPINYGVFTLTNDWFRIWFSVYDTNALNDQLQLKLYSRTKTGTAGNTAFYGAQVEIGSTPRFYLTTTTNKFTAYADYIITGAGIDAKLIADEIRSGSVFQARITDPGSGAGGSGYLTASNNAQGGEAEYLTLSQSDTNTASNYNGMRLFINSGTGAGQYGLISYYDAITKRAYVIKESIDQLQVTAATGGSTNTFSLSGSADINTLYLNQPIQFVPTYYSAAVSTTSRVDIEVTTVVGGTTNVMTATSTYGLYYNMPVTFSGSIYGGVVGNFTYYVISINANGTDFQISSSPFGSALLLINGPTISQGPMYMNIPSNTGYLSATTTSMIVNMPIQFTGQGLGGISLGTIYYINDVVDLGKFTISSALVTVSPTASSSVNNSFTITSTSSLIPMNPIVFSGTTFGGMAVVIDTKYYISKIIDSQRFQIATSVITVPVSNTEFGTNLITVSSTAGFVANNPIKFTGISFGNLVAETTYYILVVRGDGITFTVSSTPGGSAVSLLTAVGLMTARTCPASVTLSTDSGSLLVGTTSSTKLLLSTSFGTMNAIFSTPTFGGIDQGTTYYIKTITPGMTNSIQISELSGGSVKTLTTGTGSMLFGEVGWDHLNPGTPILSTITDSTSIYFIEPRLTFSSPTFSQTSATLISAGMGTNYSGIAYGENFWLAIPATGTQVYGSDNGTDWLSYALPTTSADWTSVAYGHGTWVVISGIARKVIYSSSNATSWKTSTLPITLGSWTSVSYGLGNFVAISIGSSNAAYSTNSGASWSLTALPSSADWTDLAYGNGIFVTIANGTTKAAYSTDRGETWTASTLPGSNSDWTSIAYGNGRFVAVSGTSRSPAYSFDGIEWNVSPYNITATNIKYGNGVFVAVNAGSTTAWTTEDGLFWKKRTVTDEAYIQMAFGFTDTDYQGQFVTVADSATGSIITAGSRTKGRLTVDTGIITSVSLWETGSNYASAPAISLFDPNVTTTASISARIGDGVLSAPTFFSTGQGYNTSSTTITINGNGYSDSFQTGLSIVVKDLSRLPRAGDNLTITGDDTIYKVTNATILNGSAPPTLDAVVEISPAMSVVLSPDHDTSLLIREKYSQVRLTGHDFLNIGFGDQYESGYPAQVPRLGALQSQDQVIENNFGRVFYTSTDQDGNFKVGSLFGVEQATGIVTLSASQFGLTGLEQLSLGGIAVGGSSVVIQQFSTDATFIANSDTIIPTQKAVKSYLAGRLSQGGANTITGVATAGTIIVGGPNVIGSTVPVGIPDSNVTMSNMVNFAGNNGMNQADGGMMAFDFFMKNSTKKSI